MKAPEKRRGDRFKCAVLAAVLMFAAFDRAAAQDTVGAAHKQSDQPTEQEILRPFLSRGSGIITPTPVDAYLQGLMAKLVSAALDPVPPPPIYVVPLNSFQAETGSTGGVMITTGTLAYLLREPQLANEDTLAFILAHELSHVILRHPAKRENTRKWTSGIEKATMIGATLAGAGGIAQGAAAAMLTGDALFPGWGKKQEYAADQYAIGILVKAGYSLDVISPLMDALRQNDESKEATAATARPQTPEGQMPQINLADIFKSIKPDDHPKAEDRDDKMHEYIAKKYADATAPLHTESFVSALSAPAAKSFVRDANGLADAMSLFDKGNTTGGSAKIKSVKNTSVRGSAFGQYAVAKQVEVTKGEAAALPLYQKGLGGPYAIELTYRTVAKLAYKKGDNATSSMTFAQAYDRYADPSLLPYLIYLAKVTNNQEALTKYQFACTAYGDDVMLLSQCGDADKGKSPEWN